MAAMGLAAALAAGAACTAGAAPALGAAAWPRGMSEAFVHLFEWSWADVALECEQWLGPKGFRAVQVSPPNEHIAGDEWWTRYQPVTYKLVSRSGDEKAFVDMVQRCKKVGVDVYADAVINHIAGGSGASVAGSPYGNRSTPIYDPGDMHHDVGDTGHNCMVTNYTDKRNVQYCDLVGLPDLCTGCEKVQKTVAAYLSHLADVGVAGVRIDAAKHMDSQELGQLLSRVDPGMYRFMEVIASPGEGVSAEPYRELGQVTEFAYGRALEPAFLEGKLHSLDDIGASWGLMPSQSAVVFVDNHDTQRDDFFSPRLTHKTGRLYELANIFMLAHPYGYPKVMSSYYFESFDQGPPKTRVHTADGVACGGQSSPVLSVDAARQSGRPWVCEHRWTAVANMVAWRASAGSGGVTSFQAPGNDTVAFCRGSAACVALNRQNSTWLARLRLSLPPGLYCDVAQSDDAAACPAVAVEADGTVRLEVPALGAVALHVGRLAAARDAEDGGSRGFPSHLFAILAIPVAFLLLALCLAFAAWRRRASKRGCTDTAPAAQASGSQV